MSNLFKKLRYDLSNARSGKMETISGGFICVVASSSSNASMDIAIDDGSGLNDYITFKRNGKLSYGRGFEKLYFTNTAQAGEWIEIVFTANKETFDYSGTEGDNIDSIANPVVTKGGNTLAHAAVSVLNTAATLIIAAGAGITGWSVKNNGAVTVYLGGAAVTTVNGYPLAPNESFGWDVSDALYGITAAVACDVRYMKGSKV